MTTLYTFELFFWKPLLSERVRQSRGGGVSLKGHADNPLICWFTLSHCGWFRFKFPLGVMQGFKQTEQISSGSGYLYNLGTVGFSSPLYPRSQKVALTLVDSPWITPLLSLDLPFLTPASVLSPDRVWAPCQVALAENGDDDYTSLMGILWRIELSI